MLTGMSPELLCRPSYVRVRFADVELWPTVRFWFFAFSRLPFAVIDFLTDSWYYSTSGVGVDLTD